MDVDRVARQATLERLDTLVGRWSMEAQFPDAPPSGPMGETVFAWLSGRQFLSQRWEVLHPDAPDGIAIIGLTDKSGAFVQHYFDSRGVARVYAMTLAGGVWRLLRATPDFSPLEFSQRFTGTIAQDGSTIHGRWETSVDGSTWAHDFELTYRRLD
jgi:hypothetical protein